MHGRRLLMLGWMSFLDKPVNLTKPGQSDRYNFENEISPTKDELHQYLNDKHLTMLDRHPCVKP